MWTSDNLRRVDGIFADVKPVGVILRLEQLAIITAVHAQNSEGRPPPIKWLWTRTLSNGMPAVFASAWARAMTWLPTQTSQP